MRISNLAMVACIATTALSACGDDEQASDIDTDIDTSDLATERTGLIEHQDGPATMGTVSISRATDGRRFLVLGADFTSDFATGTVSLFLAKSSANLKTQLTQDPANVSQRLGNVERNGERVFEIPSSVDVDAFAFAIVYCETVEVNFGAAPLLALQLSSLRSGTLVAQDGPPTSGSVTVSQDARGTRYVTLGDNFVSDFATGTVTIYLAKSSANLTTQREAMATNVSPRIGRASENGAHSFVIPTGVNQTDFSHVIVYCETVDINFAAAQLQ